MLRYGTDQVLAFRLARSGLAERTRRTFADAARCPASDFARDAALLAVAARTEDVSRAGFEEAVEAGELVRAHVIRGAIHVLAPDDFALYGRALLADDEGELAAQLGLQVKRLCAEHEIAPGEALGEVAAATGEALARGRRLDKNELHAELRARVRPELMPWCRGCKSHHVAPMLWRFATVSAGVRLDSAHRYLRAEPGRLPAASEAARRFLRFYGPSDPGAFAGWAGLAKPHARRLWAELDAELSEVSLDGRRAWLLRDDVEELDSPPPAGGVRLLPPGDPYTQKPNRRLLVPGAELSKRLFRPVASPGAVLRNGRLVGLWRMQTKGRRGRLIVEKLGRVGRGDLDAEAQRVAKLRGADAAEVNLA